MTDKQELLKEIIDLAAQIDEQPDGPKYILEKDLEALGLIHAMGKVAEEGWDG